MRLTLKCDGRWQIDMSTLEETPWSGSVLLWPEPVHSSDIFLQHKTSNRDFYVQALLEAQRQGFDEVLFQNENGMLTEGAISNLFANIGGTTITPSLDCGLLPGVERAHILKSCPDVQVGSLSLQQLHTAGALWLSNALQGIRPISGVHNVRRELLWGRQSSC